jgi:uncharacterized protein YcnI
MNIPFAIKTIAVCAALSGATASFPHIVLDEPAALAGSGYKAALRVGHGCEGSATTAITVLLPAGFQGAKPMPKPGWVLATRRETLAQPYSSHGKQVTHDVTEISWTAAARENWLPDAFFDEFVLRGSLPVEAGALWFKVLQTCEQGRLEWTQVPVTGTSTRGLKSPAVLLEVLPSGPTGHDH